MIHRLSGVKCIALWLMVYSCIAIPSEGYVGAQVCVSCHEREATLWTNSDHANSMLPTTPESVLGDFSDITFSAGKRTSRFFTENGRYYIETTDTNNNPARFLVKYTFGYRPLQQYLLDTGNGRLQAFDVAWDSRPAEKGGQRWYQLQGNEVTDPEHPFFWTGYYQNWNSRCGACHSTGFAKNYDSDSGTFNSNWSDVNVACESCHGPGEAHVKRVKANPGLTEGSGLQALGKQLAFHFNSGDPIARPQTALQGPPSLARDTCGGCHARRAELGALDTTKPFHQQYQLDSVTEPLYFNDGQIRDEVFILGSFLQSKMAQAGVTCTNCHDPHSGQTILPGAQVCLTCHQAETFAVPTHTNGHSNADCLSCHMPERVYMGGDARRDHRFHRPSAKHANSGSACTSCHQDASPEWLIQALEDWPKRNGAAPDTHGDWAAINQALADSDAKAVTGANAMILADDLPSLQQVALLQKLVTLAPQQAVEIARKLAMSDDPIARRGAAKAALSLPPAVQKSLLSELSKDKQKSVRVEVASTLLSLPPDTVQNQALVNPLMAEYKDVLLSGLDNPAANLGLAQLALFQGDMVAAKHAFEAALAIEPSNLPSLLGYADLMRSMGNTNGAAALYEKALRYGADSAAVQFAYGLHKIREKAYRAALPHLARAAQGEEAIARFGFVYGVALWQNGQTKQAIEALTTNTERWPTDYDTIVTLVKYAFQTKDRESLGQALSLLEQSYPDDPLLRQIKQYL